MPHHLAPLRGVFVAALLLAVAGTACRPSKSFHEVRLAGEALGTSWSVVLVVRDLPEEKEVDEVRRRVAATLERVDRGMSTWREDTEVALFNRQTGPAPFRFSPETRRVVAAALDLARETRGAFDPTVGPLVALWGFGPGARPGPPSDQALEEARRRVGWRHLDWDEAGRLVRGVPGVELDLSAIAKGYAADAVADALAHHRPLGALVEVGGEVRAFGAKGDGRPWQVGIENPIAPGSGLEAVVSLTAGALATSGDYRQARTVDGMLRTHVMDPRTGRPVQTGVASASVLAPTCMEADAVATALMVLGPERGLAFVEERPWLEALLLTRQEDRIVTRRASSGWSRWEASAP